MTISGQMPVAGLFEWLQVLELNRRTVELRLERHGEQGRLRLVRGRVVEASCGDTVGDAAARQLLTWIDACFEQESSTDDDPGDVTRSNYELINEALDAALEAPTPDPRWRIKGDLTEMSVPELLQLGALNRRRSALRLPEKAEVCFDEGCIARATAGDAIDEEAVYRVLTLSEGSFEIAPLDDVPAGGLVGTVADLLAEGVRRANEERRGRGEPVPEPDPSEEQLLAELERGTLSPAIRLLMAKGFQPRGEATPITVLLRLAEDEDEDETVHQAALAGIDRLPLQIRQAMAADTDSPPVIRHHLAGKPAEMQLSDEEPSPAEESPRVLRRRIRDLSPAERLFLARRGTRNERLIMMRHPNRRLAMTAFGSSRTTEGDVEAIARATSANVDVLIAIARHERYSHNYAVVAALVFNPKTPTPEAVRLVPRLRVMDLRMACHNPDIAAPVRAAIRKRIHALEVKRQF